MLLPGQFSDIEQGSKFSLSVEQVKVGGVVTGSTEILVSYDEKGRPLLHLGDLFPSTLSVLSSEVQINYKVESEPWPLIITKRSIYSEQASPIVEARLAREPLVLFDKPNSTRFEAVLLSPPKFISAPIVLHDENKNKFEIEPLETAEGAACLLRSSLHLSAEDPLRPLSPILNFLTFMKGCHCGLGNLFAYDEEDAVAFRLLGFSHSDVEKRETNWFDIEIQKNLPEIFTLFSGAFSDDLTGRALRQTVSFYRASNASRSVSVEMSIIAAHSALESIVNFVLEHRAGWSKSMMNNRSIAFSDKSRAAAQHFGVCTELLSQSPELAAFSIGSNGIDVFEIISRFRNKLVHQDAKHSPTGIQLHETWLIAQWLVEVLVFGVIGYRGDIIDRRVYKGWRGTTCKVPLSRS